MTDRTRTSDGLSPEAQEYWRELSKLPPAQALTRTQAADPAPPLTEACSYCHGARLVGWSGAGPILCPECSRGKDAFTVITQAWREQRTKVKALESELAQFRSGLYSDSLTDAQVAELQRDIELDVGAWDAVGLRQALLRELQRMRCAMPDLIRRSNELPGLSAAHDEAQHELAQLRREKAEREALERRLGDALASEWHLHLMRYSDGSFGAVIEKPDFRPSLAASGPTYWDAVRDAVERIENP